MAKSAAPLILSIGAAALFLGGKKKKKTSSSKEDISVDMVGEYFNGKFDPKSENAFLIMDHECREIAQKINPDAHNTYITNRFEQLVSEGWKDTAEISLQILKDQSHHCPWDNKNAWTPLMKGLYTQFHQAVREYYKLFTEGNGQ